MEIRRSTILCLIALFVGTAGFTHHLKARQVHEFQGTVRSGFFCIPEDPHLPSRLLTANGAHELDFERCPKWKTQIPNLDGKEVVVRGTIRIVPRRRLGRRNWLQTFRDWMDIWQGRSRTARRLIQVRELEIQSAAPIPASTRLLAG